MSLPGAEHGGIALKHHHAHGSVVTRGVQRISAGGIHGLREGVLFLDPVQGDGGDAGVGVDQDVLHGRSLKKGCVIGSLFVIDDLVRGHQQHTGFAPQLAALVKKAIAEGLRLRLPQQVSGAGLGQLLGAGVEVHRQ